MSNLTRFRTWLLAAALSLGSAAVMAQSTSVTYAGEAGRDRFLGTLRLSDGTVLVGGRSESLSWIPGSVPVTTLTIPQVPSAINADVLGINSRDTTRSIAYILHMDANMQNILSVTRFPAGTVLDVTRLRTNSVPGSPTGDVYISGRRINPLQPGGANVGNSSSEGYYVAKLNANFLAGNPTGLEWTYDLRAQFIRNNSQSYPYYGAASDAGILFNQPWDVDGNGRLFAVLGREFSDDWCQLVVAKPVVRNGVTVVVPDTAPGMLHQIVRINGGTANPSITGRQVEVRIANLRVGDSINVTISGTPYRVAVDSMIQSSIILKTNRNGSNLRSHNEVDFELLGNDENGNPGRKGKFPMDFFYSSACTTGCNNNGPGYTGTSIRTNGNNTATERVVSVVVDKRTGELYYGTSVWSQHQAFPTVPQDFDPAIIAIRPNGDVKWWARGYREDAAGSPALQFIDEVDLDYTSNQLVVLGRSIGDATHNFWRGNEINANPGGNGYQNAITGSAVQRETSDVRWIGKYRLGDGVIVRSTYVGEPLGSAKASTSLSGIMAGWPNLNQDTLGLSNTRVTRMRVNPDGTVMVLGISNGRIATSNNAFQPMFQSNGGIVDTLVGTNTFVRVYNADLSAVVYSSLLSNVWDPSNGGQGGTIELTDVLAGTSPGVYHVVGWQRNVATIPALTAGGLLPTVNVPAWGRKRPESEEAIVATLNTTCTGTVPAAPANLRGPSSNCSNEVGVYVVDRDPAALGYVWSVPGTNFSGYSESDTIRVSGTIGMGGALRVVAVNACGASLPSYIVLSAPTVTARPTGLNLVAAAGAPAASHCVNSTRWYRTNAVAGATGYRWIMPNGAWRVVGSNPGDTAFVSTADSVQIFLADTVQGTNGLIRVRAIGQCGASLAFSRAFNIQRGLTTAPDSIRRPAGQAAFMCAGTSRVYTAGTVTGATSYTWTLPGANFSAPSLTTTGASITVTAAPGAGGIMTVAANNACGPGPVKTLVVPQVAEAPQMVTMSQNGTVLTVPRQFGATYQWRRNNVNIAGATDTTYDAGTVTASYSVVITSCGQNITVGPITSLVGKLSAAAIDLFPNPTSDKATLSIGGLNGAAKVRVLNVLGSVVGTSDMQLNGDVTTHELDLSAQAPGVYFVEVSHAGQRIVKRINRK